MAVQPTPRPHVTQNFHPFSSSLPHAGQRDTERLFPQCGQYTTVRPSGSVPPQNRHPSGTDVFIIEFNAAGAAFAASTGRACAAGCAGRDGWPKGAGGAGAGAGGDATGNVAFIAGADFAGAGASAELSSPAAVNARILRSASGASDTFAPANSRKAPGSPWPD